MARKVKTNNEEIVKEMHKILLQNSFELVNKERFVNFFSCLTDEVKAYLLGVPMYEPIVGERVLISVNGKTTEGLVVAVNQKDLYATVQYKSENKRYFKTTEEILNYMSNGDYDYCRSSSTKTDEYNLLGIYIRETTGDFSWNSIEPNHYYD